MNLAFAAVGLRLAVFSFVSKARNSVRSLSILILSPVNCGANLPVLHLSLASPVAHFLLDAPLLPSNSANVALAAAAVYLTPVPTAVLMDFPLLLWYKN